MKKPKIGERCLVDLQHRGEIVFLFRDGDMVVHCDNGMELLTKQANCRRLVKKKKKKKKRVPTIVFLYRTSDGRMWFDNPGVEHELVKFIEVIEE